MKRIRKGNDITIKWSVFRLGEAEEFSGKRLTVRLIDPNGSPAPMSFFTEGNIITVVYEGRNQQTLGTYSLLLVENPGMSEMVTIDQADAFILVPLSAQAGGTDEGAIITTSAEVDLTSDIMTPSNGLSAYQVAVQNGYEGTEKEWVDMLCEQICTTSDIEYIGETYDEEENNVKYVEQHLTEAQKQVARENIGAVADDDVVTAEPAEITAVSIDPSVVLEAVRWTEQELDDDKQTQARDNIGAASKVTEAIIIAKMKEIEKLDIAVVGDVTKLTTDAKDTLVNAINEVDAHADANAENIGDLDDLETTAKDDLVSAINEVNDSIPIDEDSPISMTTEVFI